MSKIYKTSDVTLIESAFARTNGPVQITTHRGPVVTIDKAPNYDAAIDTALDLAGTETKLTKNGVPFRLAGIP